ncbi:MAG: glycosyltransferase family 9 protein, partial [Pyrinomonadaceae bacterium]
RCKVRRVLVVKLRSIGDTVLATPSLIALRRFLPDTQIDILLEDWVAPILDGFDSVDTVITVGKGSRSRVKTAWQIRRNKYDVTVNLHGGTTGTFFTYASGARHRVGYTEYQYAFLYNHLLTSASDFWKKKKPHSAEQQMALLGSVGVPVSSGRKTQLVVTESAVRSVDERLSKSAIRDPQSAIALMHPAAAFATKQWATEHFARTAEFLCEKGLQTIAIAAKNEREVLEKLAKESKAPVITFDDLSLPEITALASQAKLFVGNDSGIAHMAAAVNTPSVVIFGSSNRDNWRPWTNAPNEIVFEEFPCQPCPGYVCKEFGEPKCILSVKPDRVFAAIDRILAQAADS